MSNKRLVSLSFFIFGLIFVFHFLGWLKQPENFLRKIVGSGSHQFFLASQNIDGFFENLINYRNQIKDKQICQEQLAVLSFDQVEFQQLKEENDILRAQSNFVKEKKKFIVANIIGKTVEFSRNIIIIDKGSESGIFINQAVTVGDGVLVGKIIKVENGASLVRLLSDTQSKIGATVLNKDKTIGVISGEYNLKLKLTMVPLTETIAVGDQILTSGLEQGVPRGLLIGKIESIQKELYQPFQSAIVDSAVDLNKLSIISVLLN